VKHVQFPSLRGKPLAGMSARAMFGSNEVTMWNVEQFCNLADEVILIHIHFVIGMSDTPHVLYQPMLLLGAESLVDHLCKRVI
jgi:hypothetical protein